MRKIGFSAEKYIEEQSKYILERIQQGGGDRLYLEFGGKLVQDKHAMRVLPGFDENAKIKLLQKMSIPETSRRTRREQISGSLTIWKCSA